MVIITSKSGEKFEVTLEMAQKFIKAGDVSWYETIDGEFIEWDAEIPQETPKKRKNITRNPK